MAVRCRGHPYGATCGWPLLPIESVGREGGLGIKLNATIRQCGELLLKRHGRDVLSEQK